MLSFKQYLNEFLIPPDMMAAAANVAAEAERDLKVAAQKAKNYDGSFGGAGNQEPKVVPGNSTVGNRRLESNRAIEAARGDGSFKGEKTASSTVGQERETVTTPEGKKLSIIPAQQSGMYGGARFTGSRTVVGNAPERMGLSAAAKKTVADRKAAREIASQENKENQGFINRITGAAEAGKASGLRTAEKIKTGALIPSDYSTGRDPLRRELNQVSPEFKARYDARQARIDDIERKARAPIVTKTTQKNKI